MTKYFQTLLFKIHPEPISPFNFKGWRYSLPNKPYSTSDLIQINSTFLLSSETSLVMAFCRRKGQPWNLSRFLWPLIYVYDSLFFHSWSVSSWSSKLQHSSNILASNWQDTVMSHVSPAAFLRQSSPEHELRLKGIQECGIPCSSGVAGRWCWEVQMKEAAGKFNVAWSSVCSSITNFAMQMFLCWW